ncbi:MAG: restriction endonuclease subunit S [Desulfovibrionaceae bacterium]
MSEKPIISVTMDGLPSSWTTAQFSSVCSYIQRGKSPQYDDNEHFPVLNQKCVRWDSIQYEYLKFIKKTQWNSLDSLRFLQDGDILWNSTGTGTIGRACHYLGQRQFPRIVVDSHVTIVRASTHINSKFLYYYIRSPFVQQKIADLQTGSTNQVELGKQAICDSEIPLPPSAEQTRIVSRIEELFSDLDKGEENLRRAQAQLKRYRQSVLKAAVTGELTRAWREQNADTLESGDALLKRILKARREAWEKAELEKLRAKGKPPKDDAWKSRYVEPQRSNTEGLPELPEGWAWVSMGQLCFVSGGITKNAKRELLPIKRPYLRVANVYENSLSLDEVKEIGVTESEIEKATLKKYDLLIVEGNGSLSQIGRAAIWDSQIDGCLHQNHIIKARTTSHLFSWYALIWFMSRPGRDMLENAASSSSGLHTLSISKVENIHIPIPSLEEIAVLKDAMDVLDSSSSAVEKVLRPLVLHVRVLRQSILKAAFSGKLVPQDPSDEPAGELLRRIAAERAAQGARPARKAALRAPRKARAAKEPSPPVPAAAPATVSSLAAARKAVGLSQAQLAARAGINQAYVSQMETGKRTITADQAASLARALGVEPSVLTKA